jgi:hypothetical protein
VSYEADRLTSYERSFRRAGMPSFIADRTASQDIWTRAVPLLAVVAGAEVLGALDLSSAPAVNLLLLLAGAALLLGAVALLNLLRRRPLLAGPAQVGVPELVAFVVVPALLPLLLNQQVLSALVTAAANLVLLGLVYPTITFGTPSIVVWAGRRLVGQLSTAATLVARAIPLLLLSSVVLFINTEMWQAFALMSTGRLVTVLALLALVSTAFLVVRLPREVGVLEADVVGSVQAPPLDRRQRVNVGFVLLISQGLQVAVVALACGAFFVALGLLAVPPELVETWIGRPPDALLTVSGFVLSDELLRVAIAIAGLAGFYYSIAVLTDATYREEFAAELTDEMRASFQARVEYLELRERLH